MSGSLPNGSSRSSDRIGTAAGLAVWIAAAAAMFGTASCLLAGIETTTGSDGTGGTGGAGAGAQPGSGGAGCTDAATCPAQLCHSASCHDGLCVYTPTPGVLGVEQTEGDCRSNVCNELGEIGEVDDDRDVPQSPAPACQGWACEAGEVTQVPAPDCGDCCGADNQLSCVLGTCSGCAEREDCGRGSDCFSYSCTDTVCITMEQPSGTSCGESACMSVSSAVDSLSSGACDAGACQPEITLCGNYTCDPILPACNTSCTQLNADEHCQPGNRCQGMQCVDCDTCQEIVTAGATVKSFCIPSLPIANALVDCACDPKGPTTCASHCDNMCVAGEDHQTCYACLVGKGLCAAERAACLADTDPVP